ncbi:MAG TPA: M14 family zinc carboxypeptidase [Vicinamibacterales bacterium]|nr:M14 family zinc carboxypeptidase [Vicinamibacterales bacterium]
MKVQDARRAVSGLLVMAGVLCLAISMPAQQMVTDTRDSSQQQDEEFAKLVAEWTTAPYYLSPLVDHLPKVNGIPSPKDVLGHHIGAPATLTYYADILKYYRALAAATPRVKVETIGKSDEDRELVVVWVSSDENMRTLQRNRDNLAKIADPRGLSPDQIKQLIAATKPHYHLMGGLHSGETGPSEMLMELVYRLATETSPLISQIRDNVIVSVTPVADADGRDRNVDWFYRGLETAAAAPAGAGTGAATPGGGGGGGLPYWGKYVFHDNNRDINLSQVSMRALADWYFTAHPPIMHDLHEAQALMYTYSGGAPQNPNLDPILFAELPWFSNFELAQMTKWGMPGVYTHAFMDGWSPGYLGSVAYNHNGMMRMYETQSGREGGAGGRGAGQGGRGVDPATPAEPGRGARGGEAQTATDAASADIGARGRGPSVPTGRGGGQPREWYRGLPVPPGAVATFSRRNNTNYMETGVLSALQLTASFPNLVVENFYQKTKNSIESGKKDAPYGFVIPQQRDMTRAAELVNILRLQRIEVGLSTGQINLADATFPAGSYVIKRDQPYGRLAKNLLEKQRYPDPELRTYDDSGWTMGLAMMVDVKEVNDKAILDVTTTPVETAIVKGKVTGNGTAALAVAHLGSTNMIALRYKLRNASVKIAEKAFTSDGMEFPAGSFVIVAPGEMAASRNTIEQLGLTGAAVGSTPSVAMHDADVPRIAMYSSWSGNDTQEIGWVRFTFDKFGIPYDLIYKERLRKGNLRADYDVLLMPNQNVSRQSVFQPSAARAVPYLKDTKYKFLGMYGESPDITGGMGGEGVDAVAKFLDAGGTLIAMGNAVRFATELGLARTVDASATTSRDFYAPRPLVNAEVLRPDHPVFYGYPDRLVPTKYQNGPLLTVATPDQSAVLARYVGGDSAVLSGLMKGADEIRQRPMVVDIAGGYTGKGRVILFANNPIYRWQNHGEFNMVFNALMNWNDAGSVSRPAAATTAAGSR